MNLREGKCQRRRQDFGAKEHIAITVAAFVLLRVLFRAVSRLNPFLEDPVSVGGVAEAIPAWNCRLMRDDGEAVRR
ncbi:hypothetical protein QR680_006360 [Steinernema hermaphroditum]|uniref:Uncharacterized protein n=1 Tax=Steinernema hermaphroditum TaxID=289476 RepID=A0AA39LX04_9BILA|nr:hypothetical protein QR680_006360 [Steinernema hermaphroditum]